MTESPLEALQASAQERRADGTYPPGIDEALRHDVQRRFRDASTHTSALRAAVARLRELGAFELPRYRGSSPAKARYDRLLHKVVGYALADLVRQLEAYRSAVDRVLDAVIEETEATSRDERD